MPYITQDRREGLRELVDTIATKDQRGDANWVGVVIARLLTWSNYIPSFVPEIDEIIKIVDGRASKGEFIAGDLNFCVSRLLVKCTEIDKEPRYHKVHFINQALKAAELACTHTCGRTALSALTLIDDVRLELYRRYSAGYEDSKCAENGDITD